MEDFIALIYAYMLKAIMYLIFLLGSVHIGTFLIEKITNQLAKVWPAMWYPVEYAYYRKHFREWVKDKKRHPNVKESNARCDKCNIPIRHIDPTNCGVKKCPNKITNERTDKNS